MIEFAWICLGCATVPATLYLWNSFLFREPPPISDTELSLQAISVLIPARNEEIGIAACLESVLAAQHVELEVIVLDDSSTDSTAEIVREIAAKDSRLRLETAPPLPEGWCGKQAACFALSKHARHDVFTFLDADVRLEPEALARMALFLKQSQCALVSGFPRQETGTVLEKLLIPLINWLLLCWLPLWGMRHFRWSAFGAGCGQWFMTTRAAYEKVGGHAAVKTSLHDGLTLPRAYRRAGFFTDICDATNLATCRMYRSGSAVWNGLAKNAREGLASAGQIGFWSVVLLCGQVLPLPLMLVTSIDHDVESRLIFGAAAVLSLIVRTRLNRRMSETAARSNPLISHPVGVLLLLAIQWYAIIRAILGKPIGWKGRTHPGLSSGNAPRST
ncbi:MAG: glycosyl transferase [Planctomycetaceae bacterium]|nr:glycosyl transferase [Planctomycetaceae bacterium]